MLFTAIISQVKEEFYTLEAFSVRFSETDAAGLVHFTNFLRWAENAEADFFRANGLSVLTKNSAGTLFGFPRVAVHASYFAPARYADRIFVRIRPNVFPEDGARSLSWCFRVFRAERGGAETLLAEGGWKTVYAEIDSAGRIRSGNVVPVEVLSAVRNFFLKK